MSDPKDKQKGSPALAGAHGSGPRVKWCPECHGQRFKLKAIRVGFGSADRFQPLKPLAFDARRVPALDLHRTGRRS